MYQFINGKDRNKWATDGYLVFGNSQKLMSHMHDFNRFCRMSNSFYSASLKASCVLVLTFGGEQRMFRIVSHILLTEVSVVPDIISFPPYSQR